ncbi:carboxyl transferase domain-containing protein, partial [Bradyrhizobium betae]
MIKHGSKMIQAVTSATVPQITIYCGASFGAGNYGMRSRLPSALLLLLAERQDRRDGRRAGRRNHGDRDRGRRGRGGKPVEKDKLDAMKAQIIGVFDGQMDVFSTSARVLDDGVIDPRDTRAVLSKCSRSAARVTHAPPQR